MLPSWCKGIRISFSRIFFLFLNLQYPLNLGLGDISIFNFLVTKIKCHPCGIGYEARFSVLVLGRLYQMQACDGCRNMKSLIIFLFVVIFFLKISFSLSCLVSALYGNFADKSVCCH